jgi:uncharacterized protein
VTNASRLIEVRRSKIQGRGVFARRRIRKGQQIIEYTGEHVTEAVADARYDDDAMEHHRTYLFLVAKDDLIDAARKGNEARFINHSCAPNCQAVQDGKRIFIEAIRNIQPGVELTYDYHIVRDGRPRASWKKLYACWCGAPTCRGTMLTMKRKKKKK